jgi:hypothetical protein
MSYLALAEFAYNNATHASTGISPFMANYGFDFNLSPVINTEDSVPAVGERLSKLASMHSKLQDAAIKSQIAMKRNADKRRMVPPSFAIGDSVWLVTTNLRSKRPNGSLDYKRIGPFKILEQVNDLSFRLELPRALSQMHDVFHVDLLEPFIENTIEGRIVPPPPTVSVTDESGVHDEFEVEEVLDSRLRRGKLEYLVHWKGYGIKDRTWQSAEDLTNAQDLISRFHVSYPRAAREPHSDTTLNIKRSSEKNVSSSMSSRKKPKKSARLRV